MKYSLLETIPNDRKLIKDLLTLYQEIFQISNTNLLKEIIEKKRLLLTLVFDHETVIGYERKEKHFYS
ncbi:hypothetical protein ACFQZ1_22080 [Bacillus sp. CGMCC 1.60114]|uniref:hypothetical protein n=1 Tax=unclassified Bacillus (in: firmicutes) TaxID=185979 RepID=UPI0036284151